MYIRLEGDSHLLVSTIEGPDGSAHEVVLADLGEDPELNLFIAADIGRRKQPELWEGVHNFHLLQALENYKRRAGHFKPALVAFNGKRRENEEEPQQGD